MAKHDDKPLRAVFNAAGEDDAAKTGITGGAAGSDAASSPTPSTPEDGLGESAQGSEEDLSRRARFRRRGIFLLPNLITSGALFAGFYAIVAGMNGNFVAASLAIFVAMALDTADGRVARLTNTESQFGAEYDSLSDMVAFGVAPALVAFSWGLSSLGQVGWVVTFVYMACAALRLARFNTKGDNASFTGLASPSAAAIIACCIWAWESHIGTTPSVLLSSVMGAITAVTGLLMVSVFRYYSPKLINFKGRVPFITLVFVVLSFSILMIDPPTVLLCLFGFYALSGPAQYVWKKYGRGTK